MIPTPKAIGRFMANQAGRVALEARAFGAMRRAGVVGGGSPVVLLKGASALARFGAVGGAVINAALRHPDRTGLVDDAGSLTFGELDVRSNALAAGLSDAGLAEGTVIGVMCRNHRGMLDISFAGSKGGHRIIYLNTDFAAPQARDVCAREGVRALVVDEEFLPVVAEVDAPLGTFVSWTDEPAPDGTVGGHPTTESLIASGSRELPKAPAKEGSIVILTSGTTGLPKGAPRAQPRSLAAAGAVLSKIPFGADGRVYVAPPMFHAWGLLTSLLTISTGSTLVMRRRFDPERALATLAEHRCTGMVVVPVMLNRMLATEDGGPETKDLGDLSFIAASGSQLEAPLATATMDAFGDVLYNLYGSTEVAYAAIATPEDLRAHPGCVGRPPMGTTVALVDDDGREVEAGETGRVFVGNVMSFEGYTGGGDKNRLGNLVATGDVGHWDPDGRLVIDGRDDDMIVSGGENVFPGEVEELLAGHPSILEVAVIGVPDESLGQRLRAFVVCRDGNDDLTEEAVRDHVRGNLARYKVPKTVTFLDELPRNPTGKILKRVLRDQD